MKILKELKKTIAKSDDIDNVLNAIEKVCTSNIKGIIEDGYRFESYMSDSQLRIGLCREYSTKKTGEEYLQIYVDLCYETKNSNVNFSNNYDLFSVDDDFGVNQFINYVRNSEEYKYIIDNNLKPISCNCGVNET